MMHRYRSVFAQAGMLALLSLPALAQQTPVPAAGNAQNAAPPPVNYQPPNAVVAQGPPVYGSFTLTVGTGRMVTLPQKVASVFAANPQVAEVRPASADKLFIFAKGPGVTTVEATDTAGNTIAQYNVTVNVSNYYSDLTQQQAKKIAPDSDVNEQVLPNGALLNGTVDTPQQAFDIMKQAQAAGGASSGTVYDNLQIRTPIQVELKVRIASMSRTVTRSLGIDWGAVGSSGISVGKFLIAPGSATNTFASSLSGSTPAQIGVQFPGGTFEGVIDALADDNLAHVLAEPTLTTLSGSTASFQSGGELPVPSAQSLGTTSITFVNYGVILQFKPVVLSDDKIELTVEPQLSQLDAANSVTVDGTTEPSINITEASSTIVLGSGQGMAIAGLLEDTTAQTDNAVPGLGEMPILGALFRGDEYQREQQELVITVTPYLVNPVDQPGSLASPDDGWTPANDLQRILLLRDNGTDTASPPPTIPGDAGFMVQ